MEGVSQRHLSLFAAMSLVVSSMIGTGVFTSLGYQLNDIQSGFSILMLWLIGGFISLFGALCYGELGAALPKSGGEYHLLSMIMHPSIGLSAGIVSATVGFSAPAVIAAIALANYLKPVFPIINEKFFAIIVILAINAIHAFSLGVGKSFQTLSTSFKLFVMFFFIISGIFSFHEQD